MVRRRLISVALALTALMTLVSCGDRPPVGPVSPGTATLTVGVDLSGTMVATLVVGVTGPDIPTTLVFNIPIINGSATGTFTIPAGSGRNIVLRGYDIGGVETHTGSLTVSIQPGSNSTMTVVLTPLTGDLPITATLGSYIVTVTPSSRNLSVDGTAQLSAAITTSTGSPVVGLVTWATHNPGVAVVDASGIVTATGVGTTTITAVFQGVAGTATITVAP